MSEMQVMDPTGHTTVKWKPSKPAQVEAARATYDAMKAKGYQAYYVVDKKMGSRMSEFDPEAKKMIMIPQLVGG